jgi:uncharacterized protein (TIGR02266 family)
LRCWCESDDVTVYARIGNLSEGGLFLRTSTPLRQGARALVRFKDEGSPEVTAPVTVVWTSSGGGDESPPGMGLRFETLDEKSLETIRQIIIGEQQQQQARPA